MRFTDSGRIVFAVSFAVLGALGIAFHAFALAWPMLPKWIAWHDALAMLSNAILLASALGILLPRTARVSALVLTAILLLRLLLLQAPHVAAHPLVEVEWEDLSEGLVFVAGGWTIFSMMSREGGGCGLFGNIRIGQVLFALALPAIGLSHIVYVNMTAPLIPSWLPFHVALAWFTGGAHIAAGAGILFLVLPRLAATLEAVMVSLFTLLVWIPAIVATPSSLDDWSEFCVSAAVSGAAWAVAESFRARPLLFKRR